MMATSLTYGSISTLATLLALVIIIIVDSPLLEIRVVLGSVIPGIVGLRLSHCRRLTAKGHAPQVGAVIFVASTARAPSI